MSDPRMGTRPLYEEEAGKVRTLAGILEAFAVKLETYPVRLMNYQEVEHAVVEAGAKVRALKTLI